MSSSSSSSAQAGAMGLFEKYSALNRGMDDARRENTLIQSEKESIQQQMERLQVERLEMQAQTTQAREETATLNKDVHDALAKYAQLENRHAQALLEKMEARRQLDFAKLYAEEQRQDFLGGSRDFRTTCKRMRLSASAVGEDLAASNAFLERHDVNVDDWSDGDVNVEDSELEQALAKHKRRKEARDEAERALQTVRSRESISSEQSARRLERKRQLLAQLERVRKDNADSEKQLRALDEQTKEARDLAHNYEKDVNRRMSSSGQQRGRSQSNASAFLAPTITPPTAPRSQQSQPRNPYNNSRTTSNRTSSSSVPQTRRNWNSNEAQPHLNRRRRVDRQFGGVALDIIHGGETEEDDFSLPPPVEEPAPMYQTMNNSSNSILLDSDDDDDDDLLDYSVFSKK